MICERIEPYIAGYAGGDIRRDTAKLVDAHLRACTSCHALFAAETQVVQALAEMNAKPLQMPGELVGQILSEVETHQKMGRLGAAVPLPLVRAGRKVAHDPRVRIATDATKRVPGVAWKSGGAVAVALAGGLIAARTRRRRVALQPE